MGPRLDSAPRCYGPSLRAPAHRFSPFLKASSPRERPLLPTVASNLLRVRLRSVDVARYLGVTHQRVTQMVAEGKLPRSRVDYLGPSWTASAIERWAERKWWGTMPWRKVPSG
jgi:hypothetical protein